MYEVVSDRGEVQNAEVKKILQSAIFNGERAVHVRLAGVENRIDVQFVMQRFVVQSYRNFRRFVCPAEFVPVAPGVDNRQATGPNSPPEQA